VACGEPWLLPVSTKDKGLLYGAIALASFGISDRWSSGLRIFAVVTPAISVGAFGGSRGIVWRIGRNPRRPRHQRHGMEGLSDFVSSCGADRIPPLFGFLHPTAFGRGFFVCANRWAWAHKSQRTLSTPLPWTPRAFPNGSLHHSERYKTAAASVGLKRCPRKPGGAYQSERSPPSWKTATNCRHGPAHDSTAEAFGFSGVERAVAMDLRNPTVTPARNGSDHQTRFIHKPLA